MTIGLYLYPWKYLQENDNNGIRITAIINLAGPADFTDDFGWSSIPQYEQTVEDRLATLSSLGQKLTKYNVGFG